MIGILHVEDETFITDRNNEERIPLPDVEVHPTWDIDRAGSKGQINVIAHRGGLEANQWIATYRTITPERGEIVRWQRGHWRLSRPGVSYDGSYEMDTGRTAQRQTARGADIIDDIAAAGVPFSFYTPVNGRIMPDVRTLIKIATAGIIGPNLVTNGSFESGSSGWTSAPQGSGGAVIGWVPGADVRPAPDGTRTALLSTAAGAASGTGGLIYQDVNIPAGTGHMMLSAIVMCALPTRYVTRMRIEWRNSDGEISRTQTAAFQNGFWGEWQREVLTAQVPTGATFARVVFFVSVTNGGAGYPGDSAVIDDVQLRAITHEPLPDSRINLPPSTTVATTRIQTTEDKSIGYDAINADRLSAIGHYALTTDMNGRLTTMPIRNLATTEPTHTFGPDDIQIVDELVEIPASHGPEYNHFRAIKESHEEGATAMIAHSYNNNPHDPYSVINTGRVVSAPAIIVQDAVDQAALQAVADSARDRHSTQEEIRFAAHPIPSLTVYDVIEIIDSDMPRANGVWAVESIDATAIGYMMIGARRAIGGGS